MKLMIYFNDGTNAKSEETQQNIEEINIKINSDSFVIIGNGIYRSMLISSIQEVTQ